MKPSFLIRPLVRGLHPYVYGLWRAAGTVGFIYRLERRVKSVRLIAMKLKLTAVFRKFPEGYAAFVEELPGANTQGATLKEARAIFLKEAIALVLEANRQLAEEELGNAEVIREPLSLAAT